MAESGGGASFLGEALQAVRIGGETRGENLDGDIAIQAGVAGAVDFAHAASADGGLNVVRAELTSGRQHVWESIIRDALLCSANCLSNETMESPTQKFADEVNTLVPDRAGTGRVTDMLDAGRMGA